MKTGLKTRLSSFTLPVLYVLTKTGSGDQDPVDRTGSVSLLFYKPDPYYALPGYIAFNICTHSKYLTFKEREIDLRIMVLILNGNSEISANARIVFDLFKAFD